MSEVNKCPKCSAEVKTEYFASTAFLCGSLRRAFTATFVQSDKCRIAELEASCDAKKEILDEIRKHHVDKDEQ